MSSLFLLSTPVANAAPAAAPAANAAPTEAPSTRKVLDCGPQPGGEYKLCVTLPGQPGEGVVTGPIQYLSVVYNSALTLIAIAVVGIIMYRGILYILARGNPAEQTDARDAITKAVLGLVLGLSAVLILRTINPALIDNVRELPVPQIPKQENSVLNALIAEQNRSSLALENLKKEMTRLDRIVQDTPKELQEKARNAAHGRTFDDLLAQEKQQVEKSFKLITGSTAEQRTSAALNQMKPLWQQYFTELEKTNHLLSTLSSLKEAGGKSREANQFEFLITYDLNTNKGAELVQQIPDDELKTLFRKSSSVPYPNVDANSFWLGTKAAFINLFNLPAVGTTDKDLSPILGQWMSEQQAENLFMAYFREGAEATQNLTNVAQIQTTAKNQMDLLLQYKPNLRKNIAVIQRLNASDSWRK